MKRFFTILLSVFFVLILFSGAASADIYWVEGNQNSQIIYQPVQQYYPYGFGSYPIYNNPTFSNPIYTNQNFSYPLKSQTITQPYQYPTNKYYQQNFDPSKYRPVRNCNQYYRKNNRYCSDYNNYQRNCDYYYRRNCNYNPYYQPQGIVTYYPDSRTYRYGDYPQYRAPQNYMPNYQNNQSQKYTVPQTDRWMNPYSYQPYIYGQPQTADQYPNPNIKSNQKYPNVPEYYKTGDMKDYPFPITEKEVKKIEKEGRDSKRAGKEKK